MSSAGLSISVLNYGMATMALLSPILEDMCSPFTRSLGVPILGSVSVGAKIPL
jgi:hypothetical protein